jgi:hypothetical protein
MRPWTRPYWTPRRWHHIGGSGITWRRGGTAYGAELRIFFEVSRRSSLGRKGVGRAGAVPPEVRFNARLGSRVLLGQVIGHSASVHDAGSQAVPDDDCVAAAPGSLVAQLMKVVVPAHAKNVNDAYVDVLAGRGTA